MQQFVRSKENLSSEIVIFKSFKFGGDLYLILIVPKESVVELVNKVEQLTDQSLVHHLF